MMAKYGLVNESGQFIIPIEYAEILSLREGQQNKYVIVDVERKQRINKYKWNNYC